MGWVGAAVGAAGADVDWGVSVELVMVDGATEPSFVDGAPTEKDEEEGSSRVRSSG